MTLRKFKWLFFSISLIAVSISYADIYVKEVSHYEGFNGFGPKMRKEQVFTVDKSAKIEVAHRIYDDKTNELKEIWSKDNGASGPENNLTNKAAVEKYFELADPPKKKP